MSENTSTMLCAMNDGKEASPNIFFGKDEQNRLYFCTEGCRLRYGLIGLSRITMAEIEAHKQKELNQRNMKKQEE